MCRRLMLLTLLAAVALLVVPLSGAAWSNDRFAVAKLHDTNGKVVGMATFIQRKGGAVSVNVNIHGQTPGLHGIHIHGVGACAPDFGAAGSHFDPTGALHPRHAGDLGNIAVNSAGVGSLSLTTTHFTLAAGALSLLDADGSALILHAGPDDLHSHPTGNSGGRVACGVIVS